MGHTIHKVAVVTDDVEGAVTFYTERLGLTVLERFANADDEDYVFLDAGGVILELMPQKSMGVGAGIHHISFRVDSVDESASELAAKGVKITHPPFDVGSGTGIRLAFFEGPDQLNLQLFERDR